MQIQYADPPIEKAYTKMPVFPRLNAQVVMRTQEIEDDTLLTYRVSRLVYRNLLDAQLLDPGDEKHVTARLRHKYILQPLADTAGYLVYNEVPDPVVVREFLEGIGRSIAEYIIPPEPLCCWDDGLPRSIQILTNQQEIPWELTWVEDGFLAQHVIHARYPCLTRTRSRDIAYSEIPRLAIVVGRSEGLNPEPEIDGIRSIYQERFGQDVELFWGEVVTVELLRNLLSGLSGAPPNVSDSPFDIIHFIGHGDMQMGQLWIDLLRSKFFDHYVPSALEITPLVFFNACFSGSSARRIRYQADVVDSFGLRLLSAGASHFIGPLFPIRESTAREFAITFYSNLFSGEPVGLAFFTAKSVTCEHDPIALTYVLMGDLAIRMVQDA